MFLLIENTSITCVLALQIEQDTYEFSVELIFFIWQTWNYKKNSFFVSLLRSSRFLLSLLHSVIHFRGKTSGSAYITCLFIFPSAMQLGSNHSVCKESDIGPWFLWCTFIKFKWKTNNHLSSRRAATYLENILWKMRSSLPWLLKSSRFINYSRACIYIQRCTSVVNFLVLFYMLTQYGMYKHPNSYVKK